MNNPGTLNDDTLAAIVGRVVGAASPAQIILFGSAARGQMGPNSDVDLLVVKEGEYDKWQVLDEIYRSLIGVGQAVDVIVVTPEEVERFRGTHCLVIKPALEEGRLVYGA